MSLREALILLGTHGVPIVFFVYMAADVWLRNRRRVEHVLLSLISTCYLLMFAEEYVRNQVSVEYSPLLSSIWLSSAGILIPGIGLHFLVKLTRLDARMPRWLYPYVFYLPVPFVVANVATGGKWISAQQFVSSELWNLPVYNSGYYIAMTVSIANNLLYLLVLAIAKSKTNHPEQRTIYNQLFAGVVIAIVWHVLFGYVNYGDGLPPYPYLYSGIVWCYFLRSTMRKHDFLSLYDKRFEKLFNMHPDAILLMSRDREIKHANPGAKGLFDFLQLEFATFYGLLDSTLVERIRTGGTVERYETEIRHRGKRLVLLASVDYVLVDNEQHVLLVFRDMTTQKESEEEVRFLAYHDPLTRLPNRRYFHEQLDQALREAADRGESVALLLADLDKLKLLNDNYGHLAGDEALQAAAQILKETVGDRGVAARMGGDEFIVFIRRSPSKEELQHWIAELQARFAGYISKYGTIPVGMSVGTAFFPEDGKDGQALINLADHAMFEMKRRHASVT
ncbi:GGDEF domain-containing protein [Cohnella cellulosilytica]|uniref:GGDEF domain-containing protein n=1 Tax=Cohnella cellulosilytica TaxID=986710 RepID=A0ABW2FL51_9BACL